jgi:adenylate kinase family enzyme
VRRVAIISTASGNGKTTTGRALAERLGVPFVELDALHHGPNWAEPSADEFHARVEPIVASKAWVIDGTYRNKLGDLVLEQAEVILWLDLPLYVWLPRLLRRTARRIIRREELWAGNRERLRDVIHPRNSVVVYALRGYRERRRTFPVALARFPVVRLRTTAEVEWFLSSASRAT